MQIERLADTAEEISANSQPPFPSLELHLSFSWYDAIFTPVNNCLFCCCVIVVINLRNADLKSLNSHTRFVPTAEKVDVVGNDSWCVFLRMNPRQVWTRKPNASFGTVSSVLSRRDGLLFSLPTGKGHYCSYNPDYLNHSITTLQLITTKNGPDWIS